ncbi:MAG: nicotinic acid mononucleotide adenylyltransferase [Bacteroidetes bacterium HGW-Bacteroidetes-1]|jgi:nicotinate-nucleotide adenylyltransferase|nr:MAG: nicotinic acid mononucleotide adenylyltransferase [Bacteroidetes bacterium HGW-Bacteroidetes-1]
MIDQLRVGLFFGSFNPIHLGHLMLANYMVEFTEIHELWFIVSPQNPLKDKKSLLAEQDRYDMVIKGLEDYPKFRVSDVEFHLPRPSYTIDTLVRLSERYPKYKFFLVCGMDALESFLKWKNYEQILEGYHLLVYPRKGADGGTLISHPSVKIVDAPEIELSSSFIRRAVASGKDMRFFLPKDVYEHITTMHFYE